LNEPKLKIAPEMSAAEFFARARERLSFDVPPGLLDPGIIPERRSSHANSRSVLQPSSFPWSTIRNRRCC
jgi:hypothetical protein